MTMKDTPEIEGGPNSWMSCLRCGRRNPAAATHCQWCGDRLPPAKVSGKNRKKVRRFSSVNGSQPISKDTQLPPDETGLQVDQIHCGDARVLLPQLRSESVDLVVTSPPYNFGLDAYDKHDDTQSWEEYFDWLNQVWVECARALKHGGRICVDVQPLFSDYMPTHQIIAEQLRKLGLLFKAEIIWEKHNYNCKYTAWGSWKSPSMPYLKYTWEFIEVFCKGSQQKPGDSSQADITADEFKEWVYAKWEVAPESRMKEFGHPSMFPEEIPYRLIRLFSYVGDVVLDPFNGVGTTTLVAHKLGRRYIGIDISPEYCEKARERIRQSSAQARLL